MKNYPLLSIIIPVYNTEKYVCNCLDSIFSQTYENIEVIIVNNGSSGNINEIVKEYQKEYPERILKIVVHKENQGTFHGRGSGMTVAEGKYFTFMDADDRVGVDYYYQMIKKAEDTNAEIVITDMVHEDENGRQVRYIEDPVRLMNINITEKEKVFDYYYQFQGLSYSMYGIWNKIYRCELWNKCKPMIDAVTEKFALCEDAAYTTIFFSLAASVTNIHDQYYYHFVHSDSSSGSLIATPEKAQRNATFQGTAFRNIKRHLQRIGVYEKYKNSYLEFKNFHLRVMLFQLQNSTFPWFKKKELIRFCCKAFDETEPGKLTQDEMVFTTHYVEQTNDREEIRKLIVSGEYTDIIVNIKDLLVLCKYWDSYDIYQSLQQIFEKVTGKNSVFAILRINAEEEVRRKKIESDESLNTEPTIEEIYNEMARSLEIDISRFTEIINAELLAVNNAYQKRNIGDDLFGLIKRSEIKPHFLIDSVYSKEFITNILQKMGFPIEDDIIVSSEIGFSTRNKTFIKDIAKKAKGRVLNIISTDYLYAYEGNLIEDIQNLTIPSPKCIFYNFLPQYYGGKALRDAFNYYELEESLGLRSITTQIINKLFDDPFVRFDGDSNYNADPYCLGYVAGGAYFVPIILNAIDYCKNNNINDILVDSESGYFYKNLFEPLSITYGYQLSIQIEEDEKRYSNISSSELKYKLQYLPSFVNTSTWSPERLIKLLSNYISNVSECKNACEKQEFILDENFVGKNDFSKCIKTILSHIKTISSSVGSIENKTRLVTGTNFKDFLLLPLNENILYLTNQGVGTFDGSISCNLPWKRDVLYNFTRKSKPGDYIGKAVMSDYFIKGVLDFTQDLIQNSQINISKTLRNNRMIYQKMLNEFINDPMPVDAYILNVYKDLKDYVSTSIHILKYENKRTLSENYISYERCDTKLKKMAYLTFFDRASLKEKVKHKFSNRKHTLFVMRNGYRLLRKTKNAVRRRK